MKGPETLQRILFAATYVFIISVPLALLVLFGQPTGQSKPERMGNSLLLVTFSLLAMQPVLAARLRLLDRLFGLDVIYVFHKTMGLAATSLILCAAAFLAAGGGPLLYPGAIAAAVVLPALAVTAFLYRRLGMNYETWRMTHNAGAAIVFLTSAGQVASAVVPSAGVPADLAIACLFLAAVTAYVHHRLAGPVLRRKRPFRIASVTREMEHVWTLKLVPPDGEKRFEFLPGQFQFITFNGGKGEEHPFTISSGPLEKGYHTATIKESGDFTRTIGSVKTGEPVAVQAPFGRFSHVLYPEEKDLVFIAGGIGITPFASMLRHMRSRGDDHSVLLLYANNSEQDIVFRDELESIAASGLPRLRVVHVLGRPGGEWQGERGRVDKALIIKHAGSSLQNKVFYLCGPPPMMAALITTLIELGVPSSRIRSERFAL